MKNHPSLGSYKIYSKKSKLAQDYMIHNLFDRKKKPCSS